MLPIKSYCFSKAFFKKNLIQGVAALSIEEPKQASEENNVCVKEEKCEIDKQLVIYQAADLAPAENLLTTPSMVECRCVCQIIHLHICCSNLTSYVEHSVLRHFLLAGPWLVFHPQAPRNQAPRSHDPRRNRLDILLGCATLKLL